MAALDAPSGDVVPVKKSLRSKRLMRPAKSKARKASDAETQPAAPEKNAPTDDQIETPKIESNEASEEKPVVAASNWDSNVLEDMDVNSGTTDADTLSVGNRGSTYSSEHHSALLNGFPSVDKSVSSSTTYTSSSMDVFVEASDSHAAMANESQHHRGSFGQQDISEAQNKEDKEDQPVSPLLKDSISPEASEPPKTSDCGHEQADTSNVNASDDQFMQMLGDMKIDEQPPPPCHSATLDNVPAIDISAAEDKKPYNDEQVDVPLQAGGKDYTDDMQPFTPNFSANVVSPQQAEPLEDAEPKAAAAAVEPASNPAVEAASGAAASIDVAQLESEHAKLSDRMADAGEKSRGLGRSASLRFGSPSTLSPEGRRRPSEAVSPASGSGGGKKGNRRSIMLTSFVPPVGMSGGGGSSNASRSSNDSPAGSINEAPIDHSAMNGVVEISAGGRTFKRASILDSQLSSSRRSSNRISQDMGMSSIRLRPSAEVSGTNSPPSQSTDVKAVAKTALQSISERFGGSVNSKSDTVEKSDEDEDEDGMPEWMKEVQRRKREARKQEEAARAARAAAEAAEASEAEEAKANDAEEAKPETVKIEEQTMATPVSLRSHEVQDSAVKPDSVFERISQINTDLEPASEPASAPKPAPASSDPVLAPEPAPAAGSSSRINATSKPEAVDDDDTPLMDIDLNDQQPAPAPATSTDKPLPELNINTPASKQTSTPPQSAMSTRSIYRSLSASLGISQSGQESESPARQSGPPMPTVAERQRSTSQTTESPTPSQNGIFAAVTSFFGRVSTQQSAPPSASSLASPAPPAMYSNASSNSNLSRGTIEFPGMRPSGTEPRPEETNDPSMDMLLHQLEQQNQQIMKDNKARVFAQEQAVEREAEDDVDWDFWGNLINNYEQVTRSEPRKLARSVYRGIPKAIRGTVWQQMAKSRSDPALGARFRRLVAQRTEPNSDGARHEKQIRHDLARTFPKLDYFRDADGAGQEGLFSVLRAYALFDPEVGYCQGLSFVVGPLLLNMPDEEAFCLLVKLMYTYGLRGHFLPTMDDLQLRLYQFEHVFADALPWLSRHFQEQGVLPTMYVSQWLMTMFAYRLPIELTFRLFDVVFAEGLDCLLRVAVAVLKRSQTRLLTLDFEAILQYLNDGPLFAFYSHAAPDMLVRDANQVSINSRVLQKLRRQYIEEMQRRMAEEEEANRERSENEQLKQECAQLRSKLQELTSKQDGGSSASNQESLQQDLNQQRQENQDLVAKVKELELRLKDERATAEAQLKADMDHLAQKNVQLTIKNQQLEDSLQDMEEALVQIKMLYAESENQRETMTKKFEDLRKALT
ncbi:GTPase-activating protein [Coemansia sp. RSA 1290]|nr:GTPase-activating protein [Coemansia sp. RSA 1290]KAJ2651662.1 GTPase-activating protein [Coemansia sp. RSA 1250]